MPTWPAGRPVLPQRRTDRGQTDGRARKRPGGLRSPPDEERWTTRYLTEGSLRAKTSSAVGALRVAVSTMSAGEPPGRARRTPGSWLSAPPAQPAGTTLSSAEAELAAFPRWARVPEVGSSPSAVTTFCQPPCPLLCSSGAKQAQPRRLLRLPTLTSEAVAESRFLPRSRPER
jgi:hypothetical protein